MPIAIAEYRHEVYENIDQCCAAPTCRSCPCRALGHLVDEFSAHAVPGVPFYSSYVALPRMMVEMRANLDTMQWVLTAFAIAQTVMMPMVGWLSTRFGMRHLFMLCLVCTLVGSVGGGLAWDTGSLIVFRILQGLGSGPLAPLSTVILFDALLGATRYCTGVEQYQLGRLAPFSPCQ